MSLAEQENRAQSAASTRETASTPASASSPSIDDLRFRTLLGEAAWAQLPEAVRRRFSKRLAPGETIVYQGEVVETELSRAGRALAFLARVIGAPLPLTDGATGPALVVVSEDPALGGQCWLRGNARPWRFPQTIHSAKRFRGAIGLEEYVGCGVGMALRVSVEAGALVFRSAGYFLGLKRWRMRLPRFLRPGEMQIEHRDRRLRLHPGTHPLRAGADGLSASAFR